MAVGFVSADAVSKATAGVNLIPFLTEGWGGMPKTQSGNSWTLSLSEVANRLMGGTGSMSQTWRDAGGMQASVKKNFNDNGAQAIATLILAPIAAKMFKKLAKTPIRQFNGLWKSAGLEAATGVKL
jgi:hypothetical protein